MRAPAPTRALGGCAAQYINRSLLALGKVIAALAGDGGARGGRGARGARAQHVPYRDSKLTRLLQNSLGGNARTCLVACVSPSSYNAAESLSTARFAAAAARIVNAPVANEEPRPAALRALIAAAQVCACVHVRVHAAAAGRVPAFGAAARGDRAGLTRASSCVHARLTLTPRRPGSGY